MKKQKFYELVLDTLLEETATASTTPLVSLRGWDSMGKMGVLAFLDEHFSFQPPSGTLSKCQTLEDIAKLVADKLDE